MSASITLAVDVPAGPSRVFEILTTSDGQRGFWTGDCDVSTEHARFGFPHSPVDNVADVTTEPDRLVRMSVTSGVATRQGSTWEWELHPGDGGATRVLFRHYGFPDGYPEMDLGRTAQTWALILERLAGYVATGEPRPYFPAARSR